MSNSKFTSKPDSVNRTKANRPLRKGGRNAVRKSGKSAEPSLGRHSGASAHSQSKSDNLRAYFSNHRHVGLETLAKLFVSWFASLMTWLVIGIALALPSILYILLANIDQLSGDWDGKPRISLYLVAELRQSESDKFVQELKLHQDIASVKYISSEAALSEFQANSGFDDVLASLPFNPLPALIEIEPRVSSPAEIKLVATNLNARAEVESVSYDLEWIERLFALLLLGERFVAAMSVFLGLGVLLSIGNTIRLAIESRRAEIEVVKLVGGSDGFVRRPFLYLGFWYGLGGAIVAWIMVQASLNFLSGPLEKLVHSYHDEFNFSGLGLAETGILLILGAALGVLGATLAVGRHLYRIEPH